MATRDPLVERIARRQEHARNRAARLRALVPELARWLRERGARRVVLFGSLATGAEPHDATDVDLFVEGLTEDAVAEGMLELASLAGAKVDIVRAEGASSSLARRIAEDGMEVALVPG